MAWLGLTLECAHCHDHKFDPITQRDHYRFFAFFNNVPELGEDGRVANAVPMIPAPTLEQQEKIQALETAIAGLSKRIETREKGWKWHDGNRSRLAAGQNAPGGSVLAISCPGDAALDKGPAGRACAPGNIEPKPQSSEKLPVSKRNPLTFSLWVKPGTSDSDVALLSAIDYTQNTAWVEFGSGIELRLVGGELEFRFSQRFPNYSLRVQSEGADLKAGQWRHLTLVYEGADKDAMRVKASWVRVFADGREVSTKVLNDGLPLPDIKDDKPKLTCPITSTSFMETMPASPGPSPRTVYSRAASPNEACALFSFTTGAGTMTAD
jgi:hypothetical protein